MLHLGGSISFSMKKRPLGGQKYSSECILLVLVCSLTLPSLQCNSTKKNCFLFQAGGMIPANQGPGSQHDDLILSHSQSLSANIAISLPLSWMVDGQRNTALVAKATGLTHSFHTNLIISLPTSTAQEVRELSKQWGYILLLPSSPSTSQNEKNIKITCALSDDTTQDLWRHLTTRNCSDTMVS